MEAASGIRALVVDDDPLIVGLLRAFLVARGYAVQECADGAQALQCLRADRFHLVITDRDMPEMDGLALCRAIRALPGDTYIYCIMLTASRQEQTLVAAMEAGVDDFIGKPLHLPELGARLHAAERVLSLEAGLASRNRELADAYAQLSRELELARVLQLGQLPPPGEVNGVRFDWLFEASSFVGGDIFDYFALSPRHVCFYLADVSGHGVAAAMMAFHAQLQLRASTQQLAAVLARGTPDLAAIAVAVLTEYNRRFLQMQETSQYLTMLFGLLDTRSRQLALVQAGHPAPLVAAAPGAAFTPLAGGGLPVGILPEPGYEAQTLQLAPGARLALYSDGVTDCRNAEGEAFGAQRLHAVLADASGGPLVGLGQALQAQVGAWRGGARLDDDVTFLALEVH